jgi:UDP-N-acetylglucosamine diphosphorylase / glucose-1-phosphate thymidylyltransferase / UDP-N-acetylgalactosamine diphosphorylase / glucosamine-1-phosphate N-acetyltransferase / galactosamine-1-phosphate N-acetyltransferase
MSEKSYLMIKTIILSAGNGRKMWPYSALRPKALIPVSNRPLIHYLTEALQDQGIEKADIAAGTFSDQLKNQYRNNPSVSILSLGPTDGSADTLLQAWENKDEPVAVFYGDVWLHPDNLKQLFEAWKLSKGHPIALVSAIPDRSGNHIGCVLNDGWIQGISGHARDENSHRFHGFILPPSIFNYLSNCKGIFPSVQVGMMPPDEKYVEAALCDFLQDGGKIKAIETPMPVFDLDKPWHILEANRHINSIKCNDLRQHDLAENSFIDKSASIEGYVKLGKNSKIGRNVIIEGNICVGDNTIIQHGAILKGNNVIGDHCEIAYTCFVDRDSTIGNRCKVLHGAELSGIIMDGVYLYHYMEIAGIVGENTDIGAGTVCGSLRFDDDNTLQKTGRRREYLKDAWLANACYIGDYCRTGINAMIMPGVKTGARSIVGAGVLLNQDLEDGTIVQLKQELIKKSWGPERYGW